jgi:hypothetical protein
MSVELHTKKMLSTSDKNLPQTANTSPITTVDGVGGDFPLSFTLSHARRKCEGGKTELFLFNSRINYSYKLDN